MCSFDVASNFVFGRPESTDLFMLRYSDLGDLSKLLMSIFVVVFCVFFQHVNETSSTDLLDRDIVLINTLYVNYDSLCNRCV